MPDCGPVDTEPMAAQVPPDCFYVRFGKYSNLLWATRLLERQGEELQRLITARGYRGRFGEKVQSQLAIAELPFADLIGDQVIHDVALVGRDTYVADGAALGVILRAGNPILESGLATARRDAVAERADEGATKEALVIEGHPVSLISTPDRSLFSYHARRGPWHLLSNSHALVQDFLRIDQGRPSLADDPAFRRARSELPPDRADTLFLFVPTAFFEQALSPARLIEFAAAIPGIGGVENASGGMGRVPSRCPCAGIATGRLGRRGRRCGGVSPTIRFLAGIVRPPA